MWLAQKAALAPAPMSSGNLFLKAAKDGNAPKLAEIMTGDPAIKNYKNSDVR